MEALWATGNWVEFLDFHLVKAHACRDRVIKMLYSSDPMPWASSSKFSCWDLVVSLVKNNTDFETRHSQERNIPIRNEE
ncbi:hypothetical protein MC885_014920 [Smutsia gigantea]|nr:hypothetical protein MC885_014920 [Smutsia gigantea]